MFYYNVKKYYKVMFQSAHDFVISIDREMTPKFKMTWNIFIIIIGSLSFLNMSFIVPIAMTQIKDNNTFYLFYGSLFTTIFTSVLFAIYSHTNETIYLLLKTPSKTTFLKYFHLYITELQSLIGPSSVHSSNLCIFKVSSDASYSIINSDIVESPDVVMTTQNINSNV
jgi:hypothetical protein